MRETLRLSPTIPARNTSPLEDTEIIGGDGDPSNPANKKYAIKKNAPMVVHAHMTQIDPRCWGEDAQLFRPERMLDGKFEAAPVSYCAFLLTSWLTYFEPHAWQPFGFGIRACIVSCSLYALIYSFHKYHRGVRSHGKKPNLPS